MRDICLMSAVKEKILSRRRLAKGSAATTLVFGAPNHKGGTGGPVRIFAMM